MAAHGHLTVAAILVAAGDGARLGGSVPKAFCEIGGQTLLERALRPFAAHAGVRDLVVVARADQLDRAAGLAPLARVVAGGATRQASVACGIAALSEDVDTVLVHDVARPFVPAEVIDRVLAALMSGADAVVPTTQVLDTVKRVAPSGAVLETVDRSTLRAAQTPQGFRRGVLEAAHRHSAAAVSTDDAALVEACGGRVVVVDGADESFKITRPWDLLLAEAVAGR
ncbi:MAG: 2-C-methyl-D-erythritol 4-phosphate cytidylyltransferase [Actinomycetota bacterium]